MEKIKEFIADNYIVFVIGLLLLLLIYWLHHDANRNKPIYNNTDKSMERIEERMSAIESRLATMQSRLEQTQNTVNTISARIERSTSLANEVAGGLDGAEKRLDDAIQRSGRIENLIKDVERTNK